MFGLFVVDCLHVHVHAKHAYECLCVDVCLDCSDGGVFALIVVFVVEGVVVWCGVGDVNL